MHQARSFLPVKLTSLHRQQSRGLLRQRCTAASGLATDPGNLSHKSLQGQPPCYPSASRMTKLHVRAFAKKSYSPVPWRKPGLERVASLSQARNHLLPTLGMLLSILLRFKAHPSLGQWSFKSCPHAANNIWLPTWLLLQPFSGAKCGTLIFSDWRCYAIMSS